MVRLGAGSCVTNHFCFLQFQFQDGTIRSVQLKKDQNGKNLISIPGWYD